MSKCFICGKEIVSSAWWGLKLDVQTFAERITAETDEENPRPYQITVCTLQMEAFGLIEGMKRPMPTACEGAAREMGYIDDPKRKPPKR